MVVMEVWRVVRAAGRRCWDNSFAYSELNFATTLGSSFLSRLQCGGRKGGMVDPNIASRERSTQSGLWSESNVCSAR